MSDLQCPATVLVIRHGQSEGNVTRRLSAAAPGGGLTEQGREQARAAASALAARNIARVYCSPLLRARQTAEELASALGVGEPVVLEGLREFELGELEGSDTDDDWARVDAVFDAWLDGDLDATLPGAEAGTDVVTRVRDALEGVADLHRGETVVAVSHGGAMSLALPWLAHNVRNDRARGAGIANCAVVELSGDSDGWRLVSWPKRTPQLGTSPYPGDLVELLGRADAERNAAPPSGQGVTGAAYETVAGVLCAHLPLPFPWATQASLAGLGAATAAPSAEVLQAVTGWLEHQSPGAWHLVVDQQQAEEVAAATGLLVQMEHGVWLCDEAPEVPVPQGETTPPSLEPARDAAEFLEVFGADLGPVVEGQLDLPDREFLVVRHDGRPIGCARLRDLAGTTYVGGITVRPELRGRRWGRAVSALATRRALERSPLAWLHCDDDVSPLYSRLGYRRVTTHIHLGPVGGQGFAARDGG
ncbi:MAG: GNAT family N-acetyltransferase [Angustibacter sp.]